MLAAFLMWGPSDSQAINYQLNDFGKMEAHPENDLLIFLAGSALTIGAILFMVWYWWAKMSRLKPAELAEAMKTSSLLQGTLAVSSLAASILLASSSWFSLDFRGVQNAARPAPDSLTGIAMVLPGGIALICALLDMERGWMWSDGLANRFERWRRRANKILLYAMPLGIVLIVGIPPGRWVYLAGQLWNVDLHHHLNFFMMGPALSFTHGEAFGTEIYSQYGIGWPLVSAALHRLSLLSYSSLIGTEVTYVCIYYVALFFLLRRCLGQEVWAAFAVGLTIYWQIFSGMGPADYSIWVFPSSTAMRHPMDVWFFAALVSYQRSRSMTAVALAGIAAGLGVLFETETGIYLLVTFLIYMAFQAGLAASQRRISGFKEWLRPLLAFYCAATLALVPLLFYASRGTLFSVRFLRGWTEAFVSYAGNGLGALPISELPDVPFVFFAFMIILYFAVIGYAIICAWHRNLDGGTCLLASVAAYGLALLLLFVNRSHPFNLAHASIPLAVILTSLMLRGYTALGAGVGRSSLPWAMLAGVVMLLLTKPEFLRYPSCIKSVFEPAPQPHLTNEPLPAEFYQVGAAIRANAHEKDSLAILDFCDTPLYYLSDTKPWSRYASLFFMALTVQSEQDFRRELVEKSPRYVVIRGEEGARPPRWEFLWTPLYQIVTNQYTLRQSVGSYGIWELAEKPGSPAPPVSGTTQIK
jgi:hypothetical protein